MIKKLKVYLISTLSVLTLLAPAIVAPAMARATVINTGLNCGTGLTFSDCTQPNATPQQNVNKIIKMVINIFSVVVGIISVIMIIVGGVKFITSGGDSTATSSARNTVLYAVVGLVVVALAQILVRFVLSRVQTEIGTG